MRAVAEAHPNIALIKYWGKRDAAENLPAVGSLSVTLGALTTSTEVCFDDALPRDCLILNGQEDPHNERITRCLDRLRARAGVSAKAMVTTRNDFPTGAGLASSASGFAALVTAAATALRLDMTEAELVEVARIGSGSAPRSLFGGFVLLENDQRDGIRCTPMLAADDWPLIVLIAVTSTEQKAVGSTDGMELSRLTSPHYDQWVKTHADDLQTAKKYLLDRNFDALGALAQHNCLKMHAVAMTSDPALIYWSGATLECMHTVQHLRDSGVSVFYTIDAGPQLKAVCLPDSADEVRASLASTPGVVKVITSGLGEGAHAV